MPSKSFTREIGWRAISTPLSAREAEIEPGVLWRAPAWQHSWVLLKTAWKSSCPITRATSSFYLSKSYSAGTASAFHIFGGHRPSKSSAMSNDTPGMAFVVRTSQGRQIFSKA